MNSPPRSERTARLCAEAALFVRDHVLSRVSHDLRSPLNAIHSWAYVLERKIEGADAAAQRAIGGIRTGVEQQVHLLESLVDAVRSDTRRMRIERGPVHVDAMVDEAIDEVRATLAEARGVTLAVSGVPCGATVDGDRERCVQALWLMLVFAVEASAPGATVTLDVDADASRVHFVVVCRASAASLVDDALAHLLENFARSQARQPQEAGRPAWALALCVRVAEAHGGRFEAAEFADGEPFTLALSIPLRAV